MAASLDLNLKHLSYFVTVARMGSINRAAKTLFISQPYLGRILKDLEATIGFRLLLRTHGGVTLTPEGEDFLNHVEKLLGEMERLCGAREAALNPQTSLSVSVTKYAHVMESFTGVVLQHAGDTAFRHSLREGSVEEVIEDVASGQSAIGMLHFDSRKRGELKNCLAEKGLRYQFLQYGVPHILLSVHHPLLQKRAAVTLDALAPYGFVRCLGAGEEFTCRIVSRETQHRLDNGPKVVYVTNRASLLSLIAKSDFYGIDIHAVSRQNAQYGVLSVPIESSSDIIEFGYILPKEVESSPVTQEFIAALS